MADTAGSPSYQGIHHLKFPVSDLDRSLAFYETLLGARRKPELDHHRKSDGALYAYILEVPSLGTLLELRLNPEQARKLRKFDPLTIAVKDRQALEQWAAFLDQHKLPHSPIIVAIKAWIVVAEDPDEIRTRFYTLETHGPELPPDEDTAWVTS